MALIACVSHQCQDRDQTENDLQIVLRAESGIVEVLSHVDEKDLHLLRLPTPDVRENAQGDSFQTVEELVVVESSYFFLQADGQSADLSKSMLSYQCPRAYHLFVLGPHPYWER